MTQGKAASMPGGSHRVKESWMEPRGFTAGQTECEDRVLWWVPSGKAELGAEGGVSAAAAAALASCPGYKELAGSQGIWPSCRREDLKAEVQRPRPGEGKAGSLG